MKREYDFRRARRGAVVKPRPGKTRITIRLDDDLLEWFRRQVRDASGGNYQTLINDALREFVNGWDTGIEAMLRRVLREELEGRVDH